MEPNSSYPAVTESHQSADDSPSNKPAASSDDATGSRLLTDGGDSTTEELQFPDDQFSEAETKILTAIIADPARSNSEIASETGYHVPLVRDVRDEYESVVRDPSKIDEMADDAGDSPPDTTTQAEDPDDRDTADNLSVSEEPEFTPGSDEEPPNEVTTEPVEPLAIDTSVDELRVNISAGSGSDQQLLNGANAGQETVGRVGNDKQHEARIQRLEIEISKFEAYTSALETFIGENGTADELIESMQDGIEVLEEATATQDEKIEALKEATVAQNQKIEALEETIAAQDEKIETLEEATASNDTRIAELSSEVDAIADSLDELSDGIDDRFANAADHRDSLTEQLDSHEADLSELYSAIETVGDEVARLEQHISRDNNLDGRLESVESNLQALIQWHNRLQTNLTGGVDGGSGAD